MTNRDAINLLEEVKILDDTMYAYNPKYLDALDMALTALEAEETWYATHEYPQKPHWIPCSERLPEKDCDYLVWYEEGYREDYGLDEIGIAPFEEDCEGFGIWQERYDPVSLGYLDSEWVEIKVLAWMPLPEPCEWDTEDKKIIVKSGKWLETDADNYFWFRCSECGQTYETKENFCPNCGADMRSEQKEDT